MQNKFKQFTEDQIISIHGHKAIQKIKRFFDTYDLDKDNKIDLGELIYEHSLGQVDGYLNHKRQPFNSCLEPKVGNAVYNKVEREIDEVLEEHGDFGGKLIKDILSVFQDRRELLVMPPQHRRRSQSSWEGLHAGFEKTLVTPKPRFRPRGLRAAVQ